MAASARADQEESGEARRRRVDRDPARHFRAERMAAEHDRERVGAEFVPGERDHYVHAVGEQSLARHAIVRQPAEEPFDVESHDVIAVAGEPLGEILVRTPETDVVAHKEDEGLRRGPRDGGWIEQERKGPERRVVRRVGRGRRAEARGEDAEDQRAQTGRSRASSRVRLSRRDGERAGGLHECMKSSGAVRGMRKRAPAGVR